MVDIKYTLIPRVPTKGVPIFAYVHIAKRGHETVYSLMEPRLMADARKKLEEIKEYIQEHVDIDFGQLRKQEAITYVNKIFEEALNYFKIKTGTEEREIFKYYIFRDFVGLGKIDPLLKDQNVEDISCDGIGIPVYVYHRNPKLGSIKTNIVFDSKEELDSYVTKISERCGKTISVASPLLDGTLPDGSRVQATLGTDIARHGSNFTIRMFTEKPITPVDIILYGTADVRTMAFFWLATEYGSSFLISGGTATGKTSLLNAIAFFIRPEMKIVSIEDTSEIRLTHEHWIPEVARVAISEQGKVDMYELLRESLRQRPDYIIVGEVRGREAYVLFQQIAVGHPGLSTIHAENFPKLIDRLTTAPISLPPNLMENLDLIVFLKRIKKGGRYIRRVGNAMEVVGYSRKRQEPFVNEVIKWDSKEDVFNVVGSSVVLKRIMDSTGGDVESIQEEIKKRASVLQWLVKNKITDYRQVSVVLAMFYNSQEALLSRVGI